MASLALGVRFLPVSTGTADFVFASTVTGYRSPVGALTNSKTYRYRAESADLSQWEYGTAIWSSATNTLSRNTVNFSSTGSKVSFTAAPQVAISLDVPDVLQFDDVMTLTQSQQAQGRSNLNIAVQGYLFGLALSTAGASATFSVAAGQAADSTGVDVMTLAASLAKTTSAWAVGAAAGALDTGAIAINTWYHAYLIKRTDTGVVDVLVSLSATAPTMPASYTLFRRIGAMKTNASSQWTSFTQRGDEFIWATVVQDVNVATLGTTATLFTLASVPSGLQLNALLRGSFSNAAAATSGLVTSPDETSGAVNSPVGNITFSNPTAGSTAGTFQELNVRTNASAQIRGVAGAASSTLRLITYGWIDTRGKLS